MEKKKGHLTFIEVFLIISIASSILSLIMTWGGLIPAIIKHFVVECLPKAIKVVVPNE